MKSWSLRHSLPCLTLFSFLFLFAVSAQGSSIEGYVFDYNTNPLQDIDVELRDNDGRTRLRTRTDGIGRYRFTNLVDGRYYVKVFAFRYNLEDQEVQVVIQTLSILGGNVDQTFTQDFYLQPKRGQLAHTTTGVVFAQEVPKKAREYYDEGVKLIGDEKRDEGLNQLIKAVETFPTYYEALNKLGLHLLYRKRNMEAASMFIRAVEVNPKSSNSFYYMGLAFSRLDKEFYNAAIIAFGKAADLAPNAHQIPLELGKLHKKLGNFVEAEQHLVRAKKLSPDSLPEAHLLLSQLYANDLKQFDKAADELEKYLKAVRSKDEALKAKVVELRAKAKDS